MQTGARMPTRRQMMTAFAAMIVSAGVPVRTASAFATTRPGSRLDAAVPGIRPLVDLRNVHTGETLRIRYFRSGSYDQLAIDRINWLLRDHRAAEATQIDLRLLWSLSALQMAAEGDGHPGQILVLSAFRTPATNQMLRARGIRAARDSLHLRGMAVDIRLEGVPSALVAQYARWLEVGGVGHYRASDFTHIDSGRHRRWDG